MSSESFVWNMAKKFVWGMGAIYLTVVLLVYFHEINHKVIFREAGFESEINLYNWGLAGETNVTGGKGSCGLGSKCEYFNDLNDFWITYIMLISIIIVIGFMGIISAIGDKNGTKNKKVYI